MGLIGFNPRIAEAIGDDSKLKLKAVKTCKLKQIVYFQISRYKLSHNGSGKVQNLKFKVEMQNFLCIQVFIRTFQMISSS